VLILFFNYEIILRVLCGLKKSLNLGDMKMERLIVAPAAGTIREIRVSAGEMIEAEGVPAIGE
jgi:hypothetical protein